MGGELNPEECSLLMEDLRGILRAGSFFTYMILVLSPFDFEQAY
jgi:hypothetical protein